jgi:hypothetical protein
VVPALDGADAGRLGVRVGGLQDLPANGARGRTHGECALGAQPHLRPGIAPRPLAPGTRPQRRKMRIQRPMARTGQTPIRTPYGSQRDHHITTTPLRQKRNRRMPLTQPHLDAITERDTLRPTTRAIHADRADRLLGGNPASLIQRRQIRRRHRRPVWQPTTATGVTTSHAFIPNTKRHPQAPPTGASLASRTSAPAPTQIRRPGPRPPARYTRRNGRAARRATDHRVRGGRARYRLPRAREPAPPAFATAAGR